ncbi:predicted protein [Sclerotinia sclerotiorum 1980 UF-70]|uniref:Uncharacterized protein n=1 Tax=Sclerotinia sclerotiorum (strain ATCC 18683 / 1980 / Ss-1) TaxID=665079 RepID=A7EZM7_SCLS1|nr:predicted protein [Sclerotinia sclerotiorum 1980 UF-70]EDN94919.1 predicted protein [Sclerotinia sclerotiorum 1980 UF-70]
MIPFNVLIPSTSATSATPISPSFLNGAKRLTPFISPPAAANDRVVILKVLLQRIPVPILKELVRDANLSTEEK